MFPIKRLKETPGLSLDDQKGDANPSLDSMVGAVAHLTQAQTSFVHLKEAQLFDTQSPVVLYSAEADQTRLSLFAAKLT